MKKLGLAKDIKDDADCSKFLCGLLNCFVGFSGSEDEGKLVFWLDEMEDLIYYPSKNYKTFSATLRDIFDNVDRSFLVFMNFTLAETSESTIEIVLGGAVWSRITRKIRFKEFTPENAKIYVKELLANARSNKSMTSKPFDDGVIDKVISSIPASNVTPREINKQFASLILYAQEQDKSRIDNSVFSEWHSQLMDDE